MATASISGLLINSSMFVVVAILGYAFLTLFLRVFAFMSLIMPTVAPSAELKFLTIFGPQYPYPITPILSIAKDSFFFQFILCGVLL